MGTTTNSTTTTTSDTAVPATARLEHIPLERIRVREGFNPRSSRDAKRQQRLEQSIQRTGVLVPIELTPDPERPDGFVLVAGEGRLIAAKALGLETVPAAIHEVDAESGALEHAAIENLHRENLDPVDEARLCQRLIDNGLTVKSVAERLSHPQAWVRDRLGILALPEDLHTEVNEGRIPLKAVKALAKLAEIHPDLATRAVGATMMEPAWRRIGWDELASDPIHAALRTDGDLPEGIYATGTTLHLGRFDLDDETQQRLAELCREYLGGMDPATLPVRFDHEAIQDAARLNAVHLSSDGTQGVIVGRDVASQLAGDFITRCLTIQREEEAAAINERGDTEPGTDPDATGEPVDHEQAEAGRRKQQREQRDAERVSAVAYNEELGGLLVKHLSQVPVTENVLRVLTAFDVAGMLDRIAARGARYCLPGWASTGTTSTGKSRTTYPDAPVAGKKAREYLQGAASENALAGRTLVLLVAARLADERCVAQSSRTHWQLRAGSQGAWQQEAVWLLDALVAKALPKAKADRFLKARRDELAAMRAKAKEQADAQKRLTAALKDPTALSEAAREQAMTDLGFVHSKWSGEYRRIEQLLTAPAETEAAAA